MLFSTPLIISHDPLHSSQDPLWGPDSQVGNHYFLKGELRTKNYYNDYFRNSGLGRKNEISCCDVVIIINFMIRVTFRLAT